MIELPTVTEIPQNERTEVLVQQAANLLFTEVNHKEMGDAPDDLHAQGIYMDDVRRRRLFVGVDQNGDVIGAATLALRRDDEAVIDRIAVGPEHRRKNIGSQLLSAVERAAKKDGAHTLSLSPLDNSIPFYEAQGFKTIHTDDGPYLAKTLD